MRSKITGLLLLCLISLSSNGQIKDSFSRQEVLEDLNTLHTSLKEAHYDLFAYVSEDRYDSAYRAIKAGLVNDTFSLHEVTNIFQRLAAVVNIGHTSIDFPIQSYIEYAKSGGTLFPLEVAIESGKTLVKKNWSKNDSIKPGSEILEINGEPIQKVMAGIYPQLSAERKYLKDVKVEVLSFPRLYWQVYGRQKGYEVKILEKSKIRTYHLEPIDLLEGYESKRDEVLNAKLDLKFYGSTAYIEPGSFSGDEERYRQFIDSAFAIINEKRSPNLIIDLRNNSGGNNSFSDHLVSYIADKPFRWCSEFTLKTSQILKDQVRNTKDTTEDYWRNVLTHQNGEVYAYEFDEYSPQPSEKRYTGRVYVLINRQSHSQAAVTASQIQDHEFGTLVGEETGDYPSLFASQFQYTLPRTGISVNVCKGFITRVNGSTEQKGVIPDISIQDHLLDDEDEILGGTLKMIGVE